ncbi:MAG: rRNA pseudouridine synthase [Lachnospiraceae bacterium]|nr:rRNA pseudouridine synthase [Lachnospiraceae bacterium]
MRLDKYLADSSEYTRSEVKNLIKKGQVTVNRNIIKDPGYIVDEDNDICTLGGTVVEYHKYHYIMLNKPEGYVCSSDEKGQHSILELIDEPYRDRLFPIGRLDKDTTGLLILTDDGPLSHKLLAPKKHVDKEYEIISKEPVTGEMIERFSEGIDIGDEKMTLPAVLKITDDEYHSNIILHEGRYHQIKRMFEACGNLVLSLNRIRMKNLLLDPKLKRGEYRALTQYETEGLKND